jgi:sigma-B regulation protein RsbU (phosphoserine phosphatase)
MLRLHVVPAQGPPFEHLVQGDSVVIGRSSTSDLPIADRFLSRHHARLFRDGERYVVEDLGSRNGTLVNGQAIDGPTPIRAGDVIRISGSVLSVHGPDGGSSLSGGLGLDSGHTVFRPAAELLAQHAHRPTAATDRHELVRYAERLRLVNEVHQALGSTLALPELLRLILDRLFDHLKPQQAALYLVGPDGELKLAAGRSESGGPAAPLRSQNLVREVTEKGVAALVLDAQTDERFAHAASMLSAGVRSLVAAPLLAEAGKPLGMVLLHRNAAVKQFSEEDLELLVSLASVAAMRIRNVALAEEAAQRRVLEEELALARRIQEGLLPTTLPELPGWAFHARNVPSRHVSGDLYVAALLDDGRACGLMVADVAGKGMAASLLAASVEALAAGAFEQGLAPAAACERISRLLYQRTPQEKYATAILAVVHGDGGVDYANAGHNPALVVRAEGEVERLGPTGVPLGILPGVTFRGARFEMGPGDSLVLYTDGITEATAPTDEELGIDRLIEVARSHRTAAPEALAAAIDAAVAEFSAGQAPGDDRTLMIVRRIG